MFIFYFFSSELELLECSSKRKQSTSCKIPKVKGELDIEDLPPIQDLHISVRNDQVAEIGKVLHVVDTLGNNNALMLPISAMASAQVIGYLLM